MQVVLILLFNRLSCLFWFCNSWKEGLRLWFTMGGGGCWISPYQV